jgi:hypothetical protein
MPDKNEIRYYLELIKAAIVKDFEPQAIVTAVQLSTGAIELAINHNNIEAKVDYILESYDDEMRLKTNENVVIKQIMVV